MSDLRRMVMAFVVFVAASAVEASAQSPPEGGPDPATERVRIGPVWMNPRIALTNLGIDTNVFNVPESQHPQSDFTVTVTPSTDLWLPLGRSWLNATVKEDVVWYQKYDSERSANTGYIVNWRLPLNRLIVTLSPKYLSTRERPGYEIDARAQRNEFGGTGAIELRALAKTSVAVNASWAKVSFDKGAVFRGRSLRDELSRVSLGVGLSLKHQLTPLTSLSLDASRVQDRFDLSPLRDSDSTVVGGSIAFDPAALLKGTVRFGYRDFQSLSADVPGYQGATASVDLAYTLLGMTRFAVQARRDVSYSYDVNQPYYLETGYTASIAQQIFGPLDIVFRAGRQRLAYRDRAGAVLPFSARVDHVGIVGAGVGYHMGRDVRLGFNVDRQERTSPLPDHEYRALRYGTAVTYGF
jgi:hypothetical protein